ncbi:MAG: hypothetical protein K8R85_00610, partial [Bacteroidetes bacterium]|nr:hypothetical protein [Bacteroidota bacterium]
MKQTAINFVFLFLLFIFSFNGFAGGVKTNEPLNTIRFTENKNQWDKNVLYRAQLDGGVLFLQKNCFTYSFYDKETLRENHIKAHPGPPKGRESQHASKNDGLTGSSSS